MSKLTRIVLSASLLLQSAIADVNAQSASSSQLTTVYESLNSLEKATFGKSYGSDVLPTRLERLEKKLLGGKQMGGIKSRIDNLLLAAPEDATLVPPSKPLSKENTKSESESNSKPNNSFNAVIPQPVSIPPADLNRVLLPLPIRQSTTTLLRQTGPSPTRATTIEEAQKPQMRSDLKFPLPVTTVRPNVSNSPSAATPIGSAGATRPTVKTESSAGSRAVLLNNDGVRLMNDQKYDEAIKKLEEALAADPDNRHARENLGVAYNNGGLVYQNDPDKAISYFHKAVSLSPNNETSLQNLASIIKKQGKNPQDFNIRVQLGDKARKQSDFAGAIVEYNAAVKIKPDAAVYEKLGDVCRVRDKNKEALAAYQEGIRLADSATLEVKLGNCQLALGDIASAIEDFQKALALKPSDSEVQDALLMGWEAAVQDNPSAPENHIGLGRAYRLRGDRDNAKAELTRAKNLSPGKVNAVADQLLSELEDTNTVAASTPNNSGSQATTFLQGNSSGSSTSNTTISAQQSVGFGPYTADLQRRIKRAWFPPRGSEARNGKLMFKVHRDGHMTNVRMTVSSGLAIADQAFFQAIENAAPFRPLPDGSPSDVDFLVSFSNSYALREVSATPALTPKPPEADSSIDYAPYLAKLQKSIKDNWYPPKGDESKRVEVVFKVWRDGRISNCRILTSSGKTDVDQAALSAIESTSGTLSLPAGAPKELDIQFTFDYNVPRPAKTVSTASTANFSRTPKADWYRKYGQEEPQVVCNLFDIDALYKDYAEGVRNLVAQFYTQSDYDYDSKELNTKRCSAHICIDRQGRLKSIKFSDGGDGILQKLATTAIQRSVPFKPIPQDVGEFIFLELNFRQPVPSDRRYAGISQGTYVKTSNQYPNCFEIGTTENFTNREWRSSVGVGQRVVAGQTVLRAVEATYINTGFSSDAEPKPYYDELKTPVSGTVVSNCSFGKNTNSFNQPYLILSNVDSSAIEALSSAVEYNKAQLEVLCDYEIGLSEMLDVSRLSDYWSHRPHCPSAQSKVIVALRFNENSDIDRSAENPVRVVYSCQNDTLDDFAKQCVIDAAPYRLKMPKRALQYFGEVSFTLDLRTGSVILEPVREVEFKSFMSDLQTRVYANLNPEDLNFSGIVICRLKVSADGKLLEKRVIQSVTPPADKATLKAIEGAFPCKPLPAGAPKTVDIEFSVRGKPKPGTFRHF